MAGPGETDTDKAALVRRAVRLIAERGEAPTRAMLASATGIPRVRIETIFAEETDLLDAIVEDWYADDVEIMEQVMAADLPIRRKFYEFFARRFVALRAMYREDPAAFALYVDMGSTHFERVRGYIDLADHYLSELIAQAQAEGYFADLTITRALTLINQMVICYTSPQVMIILEERLAEDKLAAIIDTLFAGLSAADGGAGGVRGLHAA